MRMSSDPVQFSERRIPRREGSLYARDYAGSGPAFVLMHGFPDNLHIWDDLIPYLVASGRRVVTFDFLGFGASDKPAGAAYSFKQQRGDLEAVVEGLVLGKIVPVAHDSSGMAALNYALIRAIGSVTAKGTPDAIAPVLPHEVRATVRNHLAGRIEQWFFQTEGYGVVFIVNATSTAEAHELLEKLPLGVAGMMEFELIALGPLAPLAMLISEPPRS
jgi:pimeloyl-ACP methyl ester carboxylesterase